MNHEEPKFILTLGNPRWDRHFLRLCLNIAEMSKDPRTIVGAVIVGPDREIRSTGFNGFPRGIRDSAERLNDRDEKLKLIVHAETNAVLNAARIGVSVRGCTLYLGAQHAPARGGDSLVWGGPPCTRCAVEIIQAGIAEIVSFPVKAVPSSWHRDLEQSKALLQEAGILYREVLP